MLIFLPSNPFFSSIIPLGNRSRGNTNPHSFLSPQSFHPIRLTLVTPAAVPSFLRAPAPSPGSSFRYRGTNHPQPIPCQPLPPTKRHGSHGGSYGINKSGAHAPQLPSLLPSAATSQPPAPSSLPPSTFPPTVHRRFTRNPPPLFYRGPPSLSIPLDPSRDAPDAARRPPTTVDSSSSTSHPPRGSLNRANSNPLSLHVVSILFETTPKTIHTDYPLSVYRVSR